MERFIIFRESTLEELESDVNGWLEWKNAKVRHMRVVEQGSDGGNITVYLIAEVEPIFSKAAVSGERDMR
jgi:hypothetical protein